MHPEEVFLAVLSLVGATLLAWPLVRALAERIRPRPDGLPREELQAWRDDLLQEMQLLRREVAELGERLDFAERLLAKQRESALPKPS